MNIEQFYQDFSIYYATQGHKHCRPGWVNIECPFCEGNPGLHLGFNTERNYFSCWRCGWKSTIRVISRLIGLSYEQTKETIREYRGSTRIKKVPEPAVKFKPFKYPTGVTKLTAQHKKYLEKRRFDPNKLEFEWGLCSTGPISKLDNIDYKHRILIPIYWNGQTVSFQTRDVTGKSDIKYKACPKVREKINHKEILYGKFSEKVGTGICVEGVTDMWRFGRYAFATFGIEFTTSQIRIINKYYKRVVVIFDDDPQAVLQANKLISELRFRGTETEKLIINGDPGDMNQNDANHLVKQIIGGKRK